MGAQHRFEFFGPHGTAALIVLTPLVCYALVFACNSEGCLQLPLLDLPGFPSDQSLFSLQALIVYVDWFLLILGLHCVLPGLITLGALLPNGGKLQYKLNGFTIFATVYPLLAFLAFFTPYLKLSWIYDNYLPLITSACLFSTCLALYCYLSSFQEKKLLAEGGDTGYPIYDFWMGRELNPRVLNWDIKEFCELYPGLIGWAVINLGLMHKQYQQLGYITNSMLLVNAFELYYVADSLWFERSILTTMDITTDGFGFMLAFGDLAWVPFTFSQQARFLVDYPQDLSWPAVAMILAVNFAGYYVWRSSNSQKDTFRKDPEHPSVRGLRTLETKRGTRLITSSWWGAARHINYLGDWVMGLAWCLPCWAIGARAVVPYFYAIYFAILLVHRERRDDHFCRVKYGADWDKYCKLVPYRIVPYVY